MSEAFNLERSLEFVVSELAEINKSLLDFLGKQLEGQALSETIVALQKLRQKTYERLNQIPHEYYLTCAVDLLRIRNEIGKNDQIFWNPRQTGEGDEPDIAVMRAGKTILSCELTTSPEAKGVIDQRMQKVLEKLRVLEGKKYYFVVSEPMAQRARTKIKKLSAAIEVVRL